MKKSPLIITRDFNAASDGTAVIHPDFNAVSDGTVVIHPDRFGYVLAWRDMLKIQFWNAMRGDHGCVGDISVKTPRAFERTLQHCADIIQAEGIPLLPLEEDRNKESFHKSAFLRPDRVEYFEDGISNEMHDATPRLTVHGIPFMLGEDEKAAFKVDLKNMTPADWIEFSTDGHYAFRTSMITDMFAVPDKNHMAIQTPDSFRSFVPMKNPQDHIDTIAAYIPQLVKMDAPATAYPLYYDPAVYPPERRHHANIIMRL